MDWVQMQALESVSIHPLDQKQERLDVILAICPRGPLSICRQSQLHHLDILHRCLESPVPATHTNLRDDWAQWGRALLARWVEVVLPENPGFD